MMEKNRIEFVGHIVYKKPTPALLDIFFNSGKIVKYEVKRGNYTFKDNKLRSDAIDVLTKLGFSLRPTYSESRRSKPFINKIKVSSFYDIIDKEITVTFESPNAEVYAATKRALVDFVYEVTGIRGEDNLYERMEDCF